MLFSFWLIVNNRISIFANNIFFFESRICRLIHGSNLECRLTDRDNNQVIVETLPSSLSQAVKAQLKTFQAVNFFNWIYFCLFFHGIFSSLVSGVENLKYVIVNLKKNMDTFLQCLRICNQKIKEIENVLSISVKLNTYCLLWYFTFIQLWYESLESVLVGLWAIEIWNENKKKFLVSFGINGYLRFERNFTFILMIIEICKKLSPTFSNSACCFCSLTTEVFR